MLSERFKCSPATEGYWVPEDCPSLGDVAIFQTSKSSTLLVGSLPFNCLGLLSPFSVAHCTLTYFNHRTDTFHCLYLALSTVL